MKKKTLKNDIVFILCMLLIAGGVWLYTFCTRRAGGVAVVTVDGDIVAKLPLSEPTAFALNSSYLGIGEEGFANVIVVENGRVCVKDANCPDKVCVRTGWIEYEGESIVCLPHKLVVTVRGGSAGPDAYTR